MATGLPSEYDVIAKSLRRSRFITVIRDHSVLKPKTSPLLAYKA